MKNIVLLVALFFLSGKVSFSQTIYTGELNLSKKSKIFLLSSPSDTFRVSISKKEIDFNSLTDFQLIKIKNKEYNLLIKEDTINLSESRSTVDFSNGLKFNISKKKVHQIVLTDMNGSVALEAKYNLKGNKADFLISIANDKNKTELLAYATKCLYELSFNQVNAIPTYYFIH